MCVAGASRDLRRIGGFSIRATGQQPHCFAWQVMWSMDGGLCSPPTTGVRWAPAASPGLGSHCLMKPSRFLGMLQRWLARGPCGSEGRVSRGSVSTWKCSSADLGRSSLAPPVQMWCPPLAWRQPSVAVAPVRLPSQASQDGSCLSFVSPTTGHTDRWFVFTSA